MNIQHGVAGFINMQVKHADGTITETGWFKNLILDNFFNRFAANSPMIAPSILCRVGTGVTPPANTDTALVSPLATIARTGGSNVGGTIDVPNNRVVAKNINQFIAPIGAVVGNVSEIGFDFVSGSGLCSRSLTKDSFGTPTPITVTATDQLIVNYTLELYIPTVDYTTSVIINGTTHSVTGRIAGEYTKGVNEILLASTAASTWFLSYGSTSTFGGHGINPTAGSGAGSATSTLFTNISGGKEVMFSASINELNASGGIKVLTIPFGQASGRGYKYEFTPVIPKDESFNLNLRLRFNCTRG